MSKSLEVLLAALDDAGFAPIVEGPRDQIVREIRFDSRAVQADELFVALRGAAVDGHNYLSQALKQGASVLVVEEDFGAFDLPEGKTLVRVHNTRRALAHLSATFFDHPGREMRVVGITGTNGKTSSTWILEAIARAAGESPGVIGTVNRRFAGRVEQTANTTPESLELQRLLRRMREAGVDTVFLEVSSHALVTHRVDALPMHAGLFLNLSQDHLNFHGSMEAYLEAKSRLFTRVLPWSRRVGVESRAVVHVGDEAGKKVASLVPEEVPSVCFDGRLDPSQDVRRATQVVLGSAGTSFVLTGGGRGDVEIQSSLLGALNLENLVSVAVCAETLGYSSEEIRRGIASLRGIPGRLERVEAPEGSPSVVVDYAHTPRAVEVAAESLRKITRGRLIVVLGCGGDRDREKRPLMGEAAARFGDLVVVTSDNPRTEDPAVIVEEILAGVRRSPGARPLEECSGAWISRNRKWDLGSSDSGVAYCAVTSRRRAIALAVSLAEPEDLVLIAGKGHETYQEIHGVRFPMSDVTEAARALDSSGGRRVVESFSVRELADVAGASMVGKPGDEWFDHVAGVETDTRKLTPGAVFVALKGERFDAHDFLLQAVQAGAVALVVEGEAGRDLALEAWERAGKQGATLVVEDTLYALGELARGVLRELRARKPWMTTVAITGSNGKTTTKELSAALMTDLVHIPKARVWKTPGNFNNLIGVPLTVFGLRWGHDVAVLEHGANMHGEIAREVEISGADIRAITSIGSAHLEGFGSREGIVRGKSEISRGMSRFESLVLPAVVGEEIVESLSTGGGSVVWVAREAELQDRQGRFESALVGDRAEGLVVWRRMETEAGEELVKASSCEIDFGPDGARLASAFVLDDDLDGLCVDLPLYGEHNAANLGLSLAIAAEVDRRMRAADRNVEEVHAPEIPGLSPSIPGSSEILMLRSLNLPGGRLAVRQGTGACEGATILDDCYNANPGSMKAGLRVLCDLSGRSGGRALAVLGDMFELGAQARALHREVGKCAAELGVSGVVAFGGMAEDLAQGARESGRIDTARIWAIPGHDETAVQRVVEVLESEVQPGDVVLIKGSRGARMERIVEGLTQGQEGS